ncbi:flagellar assembly protein FliH [Pseudomonas aeruginosa]
MSKSNERAGSGNWLPAAVPALQLVQLPVESKEPGKSQALLAKEFTPRTELEILTEQVLEEARQRGYAEGHASGYAEGNAKGTEDGHAKAIEDGQRRLDQVLQELLAPVEELAKNFQQAVSNVEGAIPQRLAALAIKIGQKLAMRELSIHPENISTIIENLLQSDPEITGKPKLWLNPEDQNLLSDTLVARLTAAGWIIMQAPDLQRGGCRITSDQGEIDASVETRWAHISHGLLETDPQ